MNFYQRMGILPLKKRVNRDKCSFMTKQRMFGWEYYPLKSALIATNAVSPPCSRYERLTLENTPRFYKQKNSIYLNPCMIVFGKEIFSERNICFSNKLLGNIYFIDKHIYVLAWHLKKKCSQSTLRSYVLVLPVVCMFIVQSKKLCAKQNEIVFNKPLGVANSSEANNILDKLS